VSVVSALALRWLMVSDSSPAHPAPLKPFTEAERPQNDRYLFDYAGVLNSYEEGAHRYLEGLRQRYHIEAFIVTLPALPENASVETLANDLSNGWRIGGEHEGRGLLLLLIDDTKAVKLEVGYALEDVFTDAFTGFVEDLQLGPNYRDNNLGVGLIAVLEELEARADIKQLGNYTLGQIARADAALVAGGAGARRELVGNQPGRLSKPAGTGKGAQSPEEAWQTMLLQWGGRGQQVDIDIYTAMTRLAMGDPSTPDPRTRQALDHWRNADYDVLRDGDHAVIWFGATEGWNNAPFLFCNTGDGWKFDIVHQRRLIIMAEAPEWQITQGPYPYVALMDDAKQTTSKDLPLEGRDLYRCSDDAAIAVRMQELDASLAENPDAMDAVIELLRLNVITGQRPDRVQPLIQRAKRLAPDSPEPYKYAAIYNANTFFQYQTALDEMARYQTLLADDAFGYRMQGFLLYRLGRYADSIDSLERAARLDPDNSYAYALMARDYALLARSAPAIDKRRLRDDAREMREKTGAVSTASDVRLQWLNRWLEGRI
jgi:tetratricopeptide (TPR) repeat protein